VNTVLFFAVPCLGGALIGFVTNLIAVRMLFRPLEEIRVFGVRLPFTPGLIPRQRHRLAESIGAMAEREFFTPELLRRRLERPEIREKLRDALAAFTRRAFAPPLREALPADIQAEAERGYNAASASFIRFLRRNDIHAELEARGQIFLAGAILKLNVFQRFFLSAGQYDLTLNQRMGEIIDDLISQTETLLAEESFRKKLLAIAGEAIERFFFPRDAESPPEIPGTEGEGKRALDELLTRGLLGVIDERLDSVLASLDLRGMVRDRINSLEMIKVERIILDIMADQLKWIDLFGAVLGFAIGLFQALFSRYMGG
jgi:uncharacterized membrane protein YheB (UPF0754 family)